MKVTRITQQEKQRDRYSIFIDDKYAFSLSEGALLESKLAVGQELDKAALKQWKQVSADDKIYNQALRYAAVRLRSTWEMEQYLRRKDASPPLVEIILNKLSIIDLLNDEAFARAWMANRRLLRPTSTRKLQQELRVKRIADEVIEAVLSEEATGDDLTALREVVVKKRNLPKYRADPMKLMNYLAHQGFSYGDIKDVLAEYDS